MGADLVRAQVRAVADLSHGVTRFGEGLQAGLASARSELNRHASEFQTAVIASDRALRDAQRRCQQIADELERCEGDCNGLAEASRRANAAEQAAQRGHDMNRRAHEQFERAGSDLMSALRSAEASMSPRIPATKKALLRHVQELNAYLATQVGG
jgi:hypothetical protein